MLVRNPETGAIINVKDPSSYLAQGYTEPSTEELEKTQRELDYGTTGQQAQAQGERLLRGATLGQVTGFGTPEEIRARDEVSRELSPVTSFAADVAPALAVGAATGGLAGAALGVEAGVGASTAARLGTLAAGELGGGLVQAAQTAYGEGRTFGHEDIGRDVEQTALWAGLGTALGGVPIARQALTEAKAAKAGVMSAEEVAHTAAAAEGKAAQEAAPDAAAGLPAGERSPAYQRARERIDQQRAAAGGVDVGPAAVEPASPKVAKLQTKLEQRLSKLRELEGKAPAGSTDDLGANDIAERHGERVTQARDQVEESLHALHDEYSGRISDILEGRAPEELPPKARAKYDRYKAGLDELEQTIGAHGGGTENVQGIDLLTLGDSPKAAEAYLGKVRGNQRGFTETGQGIGDILTSPIGATTVGAGAGIAADQLGLDPEQAGLVGLGVAGATALLGHGRGLGALSRLERKAGASAAESAAKEAADNGMSRAVRNASKADAEEIVAKATRGAAETVEPEASGLFRDRRLYQNREAILDSATREMQTDLGAAVRDARGLTENQVQRAAGKVSDNLGAQQQAARTMAENSAKWSGQLKAEARANAYRLGKGGMYYAAPEEKALTLALIENAQQIGKAKTGAEMFEAGNALKQATLDLKDKLAKVEARSPAQERLLAKLDEFSGTVQRGLEDNKTWGDAGNILAAHHQTAGDLLPSLDAFEKKGWEKQVRAVLDGPDPEVRAQVSKMLDAMTANAESSLKFGGDRVKAEAVIAKADKVRRTLGLADEVADATGRMETIGKAADSLPFVGKSIKGAITGDLGSAYRRLTQATDSAVGRSVDDWIRSSKIRGGGKIPALLKKLPQMSPEVRALAESAQRRGVTVGMARFMGNDDSPQKAFERRRDALLDEDSFFERVSGDFSGLQEQSPEAFMLLSGKVAEARAFLLDRMPANVAVSVARPGGYPPSREAVEDWSIYWNAVEHPIDTVKNLAGLRIQEAETISKLYPRLWEQTQQTVLEKIGNAQVSGEPLDDTMLMRLDLMFGFDGAGSSAFSTRAAKTGASAQPPAPPGGGSSRAPTDAKRMVAATPSLTGATMGTVG
jgi:hypothetical protein